FYGRSGTMSAGVYLVSPQTAAYSAITGVISNPAECEYEDAQMPESYITDDSMLILPDLDPAREIIQGPNIKPFPLNVPLTKDICGKVMIKVEDNITTDHIMPAGAKILPYRSNIVKISEFCFSQIDAGFHDRCKQYNGGIIVARENYGQGSSREHAALAPMYLGIKAVFANSYARIHRQNLINSGIIPCLFTSLEDYTSIDLLDELELTDSKNPEVGKPITVVNHTKNHTFTMKHDLTEKEIRMIKAGGLLKMIQSEEQV
ncbi:MAG: threonyl-tRNA synthetase, partial [Erysipelotrichaceae bacterium]|nr:threonyl-tRNA synthetase [Erysipelotrichaceae bacterium]